MVFDGSRRVSSGVGPIFYPLFLSSVYSGVNLLKAAEAGLNSMLAPTENFFLWGCAAVIGIEG